MGWPRSQRAGELTTVSVATVFYGVTVVLFVVSTVWVALTVPDHLAVHFSFGGQPNGYMTRGVYLGFIISLTVLASVIIPIASIAGARRGHRPSGIANVRFWSRPENRALYIERFTDLSLVFGGVCALVFSVVNALVIVANRNGVREMPLSPWVAGVVVAAMVAVCVWAARWYGRLPDDHGSSPR